MRVWTLFRLDNDSVLKSAVHGALTSTAIELVPYDHQRSGPGLVFFDAVSAELCGFLREVTRGREERVLAVGASRSCFDSENCWQLLDAGASDVLAWDHSDDPAADITARLLRLESVDTLIRSPVVQEALVGESPNWKSVLRQIVEVAHFTSASVLIQGESGTGKELVARLIHNLDARKNKGMLLVLDCTTIVPSLSGSEFFGHEKGSFTGAIATRDGAFARAHGGTLFLDEIGELPLPLQAELLRVIQEGMYKRVGSDVWRQANFRLLCATNRDLLKEAEEGRFRKDLYYRIAAWVCALPSLRERIEDIPLLARHFLKAAPSNGKPFELDSAVKELLLGRAYPGNIRELKHLIARICSRHEGPGPITVGDVPPEERPIAECHETRWNDDQFEQQIRRALAHGITLRQLSRSVGEIAIRVAIAEQGNIRGAAARLGVSARALHLRKAAHRQLPT
jgi:transcriptional regulator with GAF, ATPase, and Fis domain